MTKTIGIFAPGGNEQARLLTSALAEAGCRTHFFDTLLPDSERAVLEGENASLNSVDLMQLDTAYIHGFAHESPVVPDPAGMRDFSVWQADYPARQQKYSFLYSLLTRMEQCGVRPVNTPDAARAMFAKLHLLGNLKREGLDVPDFISTNDPSEADAFAAPRKRVVWRPQNGRGAWQLCLKKQREALVRPDLPPPLMAEAKTGPVVRCWIFEGEPLVALSAAPPSNGLPERLELLAPFDTVPYRESLARLAKTIDIPWFQVLFIPEADRAWIYDIDADPILDWLPETFRITLTHSLAERLSRDMPATKPATGDRTAPAEAPAQRPALFLTRMLRVLFEFEKSKYGK